MEIGYADIVSSAAGHDKGAWFLVVGVEEKHFLLADGKNRPLERPKRKNKKHVRYMGKREHPALSRFREGGRIENKEIRKLLAIHRGKSQDDLREANTLGQR
jgi:ribosomal protein L14E/L6E/L27E